jgi:dihydroorotate dehydrogenase (NAD+) catalytic subunit
MHGSDTVILTLEGSWEYEPGQFVFLWIPQVGEKPFSIAEREPLTFVIKRRGVFTRALFDLEVGDDLYVRGLYGEAVKPLASSRAILVAGGTGVAVLPALAHRLHEEGTAIRTFIGTSEREGGLLEQSLAGYGPVLTVCDDGVPGRVLSSVKEAIENPADLACYIVGPTAFMRAGALLMLEHGVSPNRILLSLELNTLCGIGMCGECLCGDRLTCSWGTFMDYAYLRDHAPELL